MASAVVGTLRALLTLDTADYEKGLVRAGKNLDKVTKDWAGIGRQATAVGKTLTQYVTLPLAGMAAGAIKAATDFESSFANVRKTVDGTDKELDGLAKSFRQMAKEIPASTDELNNIAALGGQMGVPISQLEKFTRNVSALGVAVDGISTEEAAAGLAQIGNIAGTGTTQIDKMASTLVHLGNNANATESDILEFTKRLMGAGASAGMTVPQVMAIGTAMADVGLNAEAGGTAMSTMIAKMSMAVSTGGRELENFARVAGMTAEQFKALWRQDSALAVNAIVTGLNRMKEEGADLNLVVRDIGATNVRTAATMKQLALAGDGVSRHLETANVGWQTGNKHLEEAEKKYATTANQLKLLWNQIKDVGITLGNALLPPLNQFIKLGSSLLPLVDGMAKGFAALPGPVQGVAVGLVALAAAAGPAIWAAGSMITAFTTVSATMGAKGIATRLLSGNLGMLSTALRGVGPAALIAGTALAGWQIGKHIGEITGATQAVQNLTEKLFNLRDASEPLESQQRTIATAIRLGADESVTFAQALQFLKDRAAALRGEWAQGQTAAGDYASRMAAAKAEVAALTAEQRRQISAAMELGENTEAIAKRFGLSSDAMRVYSSVVRPAVTNTEDLAEAQAKAKEAAEKLNQEVERQRQALSALGLVTDRDVNEAIFEFQVLLGRAAAEGVPLKNVADLLIARLKELREKALAAGLSVEGLDAALDSLRGVSAAGSGPIPTLTAQMVTGKAAADALGSGVRHVSGDMLDASRDAAVLGQAYETLGVKGERSALDVALAYQDAYNTLVASGKASYAELDAARQKMVDAEIKAGLRVASAWRQYAEMAKGYASTLVQQFSRALLGFQTETTKEKKRLADDAKRDHERTQQDAADAVARAESQARDEYARSAEAAEDRYTRELGAAEQAYREKLDAAEGNQEAIKAIEIWYAHERQRIDEAKNAALIEADKVKNDTITAAAAEANAEIEASHKAMQDAIEAASHPWRDRMVEIWGTLKSAFGDIITAMVGDFIQRFIGGTINALLGHQGAFGAAFAGLFGGGGGGVLSPGVLTAPGGTGAGAGLTAGGIAAGAGLGLAAGASAYAQGWMATEWAKSFFGDHFTSPEAQAGIDAQKFIDDMAYLGLSLEDGLAMHGGGLSQGALDFLANNGLLGERPGFDAGGWGNFGAGTPVDLHGNEAVFPLPPGFDLSNHLKSVGDLSESMGDGNNTFILEVDGTALARVQAPHIVGEVRRLQLAW